MFIDMVEQLIQEAIRAGKFDHLHEEGRPIDLRAYFETPAELRSTYAALRSAGVLPREVELLREIAETEAAPRLTTEDESDGKRRGRVERRRLELYLILERHRHGHGHG